MKKNNKLDNKRHLNLWLYLIFIYLILSIISTPLLTGCNREKCTTPGRNRCDNNTLQICSGDKYWHDNVNCEDYDMICKKTKDRCTCMEKE